MFLVAYVTSWIRTRCRTAFTYLRCTAPPPVICQGKGQIFFKRLFRILKIFFYKLRKYFKPYSKLPEILGRMRIEERRLNMLMKFITGFLNFLVTYEKDLFSVLAYEKVIDLWSFFLCLFKSEYRQNKRVKDIISIFSCFFFLTRPLCVEKYKGISRKKKWSSKKNSL